MSRVRRDIADWGESTRKGTEELDYCARMLKGKLLTSPLERPQWRLAGQESS